MDSRAIPDIKEAEKLLCKAEECFPSVESSQLFREAFELLNDLLEQESHGEQVSSFVSNLKRSYTRSVVEHLSEIDAKDFDKYVHYLIVLLLHMDDEFEALRASHPELRASFNQCKIRFGPQLDELLSTLQRTPNNSEAASRLGLIQASVC